MQLLNYTKKIVTNSEVEAFETLLNPVIFLITHICKSRNGSCNDNFLQEIAAPLSIN